MFSQKLCKEGLISIINAFFALFLPFLKTSFKGRDCNFKWSFGKVIHSKSMKIAFVALTIRHKSCMIYAFVYFFVQKSFLDHRLFSYCWDKFDNPGSIVYFSIVICQTHNIKKFSCIWLIIHLPWSITNQYNVYLHWNLFFKKKS